MAKDLMKLVEDKFGKKELPKFRVGDTVEVRTKIREGDKERIQPFSGVVIRHSGRGLSQTFTVRRIVQGEGVERTFPLQSPHTIDVAVTRRGSVRRARLYYLRKRAGKSARIRAKTGPGEQKTGEQKTEEK